MIFAALAALALGALVVGTYRASGTTGAGMSLLGGVIVVGLAAAMMYAIASPTMRDGIGPRATHGFDGGGGYDGGGGGDFGGGGGGGDC
jgi:hypothetical protein